MSWWSTAVGRTAQVRHTVTSDELREYGRLTGDIPAPGEVPEPIVAGLFSRLLGTDLPGRGTNYLKQRLTVHRPAPVGRELVARVEVVRVRPDKQLVDLHTTCSTTDGVLRCDGTALVRAPHIPR